MNAPCTLIIRGISLPYKEEAEAAIASAVKKLKRAGVAAQDPAIYKRSVDARKKNDIRFVYSVAVKTPRIPDERTLQTLDACPLKEASQRPQPGKEKCDGRIVVVGFGPCGMFAALTLARAGYAPLIIERGEGVRARKEKIDAFRRAGVLDTESNVQFGAGGAGSFSDGKLITRIGDPLGTLVLETYAAFGAPKSILTLAKPHIGTDKLLGVVDEIEKEIVRLGGEVHYGTKLVSCVYSSDGRVKAIRTNQGEIQCKALIAAIGHSARDTYNLLHGDGFTLMPKDFSVGVRIEHLQDDIDRAMYGDADVSILGHAEYSLSMREGDRGVYSFCMCPGGEVICASSEEEGLVVNGMSNFARSGVNANSAIAVSVLKEDYGADPMKAIAFQRHLENEAYKAADGGFRAPIETLDDFMNGTLAGAPTRVFPSYRDGKFTTYRDLTRILPQEHIGMMRRAFRYFDRQISGFAAPHALLTGVETRTSAPLRILRNETLTAPGHTNVYPCGEGAGYAGGITSAAVDGIRTAYALISRYAPER